MTLGQQELDGLGEVACAASGAASARERAHDVLAALQRLLPYDSALFATWDPLDRRHRPVANHGYAKRVVDHLCSEAFEQELLEFGASSAGRAFRVRDLPCEPSAVPTFANVFSPEGFDEGLTVCLHASGGRYVGMLNLSTTSSTGGPSDSARDAIDLLAGTLANAIDTARLDRHLVELADPGAAAVMIGLAGDPLPVPGSDQSDRIAEMLIGDPRGPLADARQMLHDRKLPERFVWRPQGEAGWRRVHVIACEGPGLDEPRALLGVGSPIHAYGLTVREMEVLSLLVEGWSNRNIAEHFVVAPRTVATHVERVLSKLDEHSRAGAAGRATREGLLVPFVDQRSPLATPDE